MFIKGFNALQLTALFAVWPFLCDWVKSASFYGSGPVFWIMVIVYIIGFCGMVGSVFHSMEG
jgi:hypothetical protein